MVCIFCVYLSVEFRESFRRYWMKWRYGILIETVRTNLACSYFLIWPIRGCSAGLGIVFVLSVLNMEGI